MLGLRLGLWWFSRGSKYILNMINILCTVGLNILSLFLFYFFKNFIPSYFGEKGKNRATKEDIGDITKIVEEAKTDFTKQNESLKSLILTTNQHRMNIKSAEREALFNYNSKVSALIYSILRFKLSNYNLENYKELKNVSSDFLKKQYECDLAEAHLHLFMHGQPFLNLKEKLTISIIDFQYEVQKSMDEVYNILSSCGRDLEIEKDDFVAQFNIKTKMEIDLVNSRIDILENYKNVELLHAEMIKLIKKQLIELEL